MNQKMDLNALAGAILERKKNQKIMISSLWEIEHWRDDKLLAKRIEENLCPDEFINHVLDIALSNGSQITNWYLALFSNNHSPAAGDTYATPGFTEATGYDETTRPQWNEAGVSAKSISNKPRMTPCLLD